MKYKKYKFILFFLSVFFPFLFASRHRHIGKHKNNIHQRKISINNNSNDVEKELLQINKIVNEPIIYSNSNLNNNCSLEKKKENLKQSLPLKKTVLFDVGIGDILGLKRVNDKLFKKHNIKGFFRKTKNKEIFVENSEIHKTDNNLSKKLNHEAGVLGNLLNDIKDKVERLSGTEDQLRLSKKKIKALDNKISNTMNQIKGYLNSKFEKFEEKLNNVQKVNKEAELNRKLAEKLAEKNQRVGNVARKSIDIAIRTEVDKQLATLKEERLEKFEKILRKRQRKKKVRQLKKILRDALEDYD